MKIDFVELKVLLIMSKKAFVLKAGLLCLCGKNVYKQFFFRFVYSY
jgi:hypothetical protein